MRSFSALALGLALVDLSAARVTTGSVQRREEQSNTGVVGWLSRLFKKDIDQRAALDTCVVDSYYDFVYKSTFGGSFCRALMDYPNVTVVQDFQPVTTITTKFSTHSGTRSTTIHTTPITTITITAQPSPVSKRGIASNGLVGNGFLAYRQVAEANGTAVPGDAVMSAAFVSACNCQSYVGPTIVSTRTLEPLVETVSAFDRVTTTIATTRTEPTSTVYTTVPAVHVPAKPTGGEDPTDAPSSGGSSTSAAEPAGPTAPAFSCPEDDKSIVNQLVGSLRYDYLVLCDTDLTGGDVYNALSYSTYSECAAACSVGDTALGQPICEGFVFYHTQEGHNCILKNTTGNTIPAAGVDSGLLQAVAQGISESNPQGVTTERAPFLESATLPASEISSSLASVLSNSSTSIAVITPGPSLVQSGRLPAAGGATIYSTFVSNGQTISTGTAFNTYVSANGSWYSSYYTSFSLAWSSATTVYASSETSTAISNFTNTENSLQSGNNGDYSIVSTSNTTYTYPWGYNVTEVISNITYNANNTQLASTATTYYFTYATSGAGSGSGGANGGSGAGVITSSFPAATSTTLFSGVSVIVSNGQTIYLTYGGGNGVAQQTPPPSVQPSIITNTYGTAWSSGYVASGIYGQGGGAGAGGAAGVASSGNVSPTPISSTIISGATSGESGTALSGAVSSAPLTPISSTIVSTGIGGESSTVDSGSIPPFTNSLNSRSGTLPPSSGAPLTPVSSTIFSTGISGASSSEGQGSAPSSGLAPPSGLTPPSPYSSGVFSTGTSGASSTFAWGSIPSSGTIVSTGSRPSGTGPTPISLDVTSSGISGASSTEASGAIPSSETPFTNSLNSRSGSLPPSSGVPPTGSVPLGTGPSSYPSSALFTNSINSRSYSLPTFGTGSIPLSTGPSSYPSSALFTNSINSRSGSLPTFGTGSIPLSTGPSSYPSSAPFTNSINSRSGTLPPSSGTLPTGSPSSSVPFTNSLNSRSDSLPPSSSAPSGTGFSASSSWGTGSSFFSTGFTAPYVTGSTLSAPPGEFTESIPFSVPTGSLPSSSLPGTGSSSVPFTNSLKSRSGSLPPSGTVPPSASLPSGSLPPLGSGPPPTGWVPTGSVPLSTAPSSPSSSVPFTNSLNSRSGTFSTPSGIAPFSTGTAPATSAATTFPPYPTAATSCVTNFLGTTTIFTTVTELGCFANCPAGGGYGYNANTFGPPSFGGQGGGRGPY